MQEEDTLQSPFVLYSKDGQSILLLHFWAQSLLEVTEELDSISSLCSHPLPLYSSYPGSASKNV